MKAVLILFLITVCACDEDDDSSEITEALLLDIKVPIDTDGSFCFITDRNDNIVWDTIFTYCVKRINLEVDVNTDYNLTFGRLGNETFFIKTYTDIGDYFGLHFPFFEFDCDGTMGCILSKDNVEVVIEDIDSATILQSGFELLSNVNYNSMNRELRFNAQIPFWNSDENISSVYLVIQEQSNQEPMGYLIEPSMLEDSLVQINFESFESPQVHSLNISSPVLSYVHLMGMSMAGHSFFRADHLSPTLFPGTDTYLPENTETEMFRYEYRQFGPSGNPSGAGNFVTSLNEIVDAPSMVIENEAYNYPMLYADVSGSYELLDVQLLYRSQQVIRILWDIYQDGNSNFDVRLPRFPDDVLDAFEELELLSLEPENINITGYQIEDLQSNPEHWDEVDISSIRCHAHSYTSVLFDSE